MYLNKIFNFYVLSLFLSFFITTTALAKELQFSWSFENLAQTMIDGFKIYQIKGKEKKEIASVSPETRQVNVDVEVSTGKNMFEIVPYLDNKIYGTGAKTYIFVPGAVSNFKVK